MGLAGFPGCDVPLFARHGNLFFFEFFGTLYQRRLCEKLPQVHSEKFDPTCRFVPIFRVCSKNSTGIALNYQARSNFSETIRLEIRPASRILECTFGKIGVYLRP